MNHRIGFGLRILLMATILPSDILGQSENVNKPLTKIGGYLLIRNHGLNGYILNLEQERVFKSNMFFSHGPRLDYYKANGTSIYPTYFFGTNNLILGYELKFYPFHFIKRKPYQGFFIGAYPCYFTPIDKRYKNGPGIGSPVGYQYIFRNKISLGVEGCVIYMQNVNDAVPKANPQDRYYYILLNIKVGIKL